MKISSLSRNQIGERCSAILLIALLLSATSAAAQTSKRDTASLHLEPRVSLWINSYYGSNNGGAGLSVRWYFLGIGMTFFKFAGDTSAPLKPRPGGIEYVFDAYIIVDIRDWLAAYGSVGAVGRLQTYSDQAKLNPDFKEPDPVSVGGGVQAVVSSHILFGVGYNVILPTVDSDNNKNRHRAITSFVGQLGWRF